jgi:hypothetical protein
VLPWLRPDWISPVLNCQQLLYGLNYAAIVLEVSLGFLLMFRPTRWIGCGMLLVFFGGLIFPLRIDWIGLVGLPFAFAIAAASPFVTRRLRGDVQRWHLSPLRRISRLEGALGGLLIVVVGLNSVHAVLSTPWGFDAVEPFRCGGKAWMNRHSPQLAKWINRRCLFIKHKVLFSSPHIVDVWAFRVEVDMPDGTTVEPVQVFFHDKTGGPHTSALGMPRFYQACMYKIGTMAKQMRDGAVLSSLDTSTADTMMQFAAYSAENDADDANDAEDANLNSESDNQSDSDEDTKPERVRLLVSPIVKPVGYKGDVEPWLDSPWTIVREYDVAKDEFRFVERPVADPPTVID